MKTQGTGVSGTASVNITGLAYKVGLGVIVAGVLLFASSGLLGGVVSAAIMDLLTLMGAPEDRQFLPPDQPAGGQILQHFGGVLLACGVCIVSIRLVAELLGLAGKPGFTARLSRTDKLGLGVAVIGFLAMVSTGLVQSILYEIFLYDYGRGAVMSTLEIVGYAGGVVLLGGLAVFILGKPNRHRVLLGWTDRVGWGKLGYGWINKLGLGLIVLTLIAGTLMPGFADAVTIFAAAGICILLVGIVPHFLGGGRP